MLYVCYDISRNSSAAFSRFASPPYFSPAGVLSHSLYSVIFLKSIGYFALICLGTAPRFLSEKTTVRLGLFNLIPKMANCVKALAYVSKLFLIVSPLSNLPSP